MLKIEDFPKKIRARCLKCGLQWKWWRVDGLICPFCATAFEEAYFHPSFVELDGKEERW